MEPVDWTFQLSDAGEQIVRTYECTRFKHWFRPPTPGYLTVTNKRVIFHSSGKSLTGQSVLSTEMPLDDVSGLSMYEGLSFNWPLFLAFSVVLYIVSRIASSILPSLFFNYWFVLLLVLPYAIIWLLSSNILQDNVRDRVFQTLDQVASDKFTVSRDLDRYRPYALILLCIGLALFAWRFSFTLGGGAVGTALSWVFLLAVYAFIFMNFFGRQRTFSLLIGSKTMKASGIFIPGDTLQLLSTHDRTALQALGAAPSSDSSQVIKELGALLLDLQQLGDLGVEKWRQPQPAAN